MEAVISGQAGVAFLLMAGDQFASIHVGEPEVLTPRAIGDLPFLFGDASDLQFLEDVDHAEVVRRLQIDQDKADALYLSLILLDPDLSIEVRREAANDLEDLYRTSEVFEYVERILLARPLPPSADLVGAMSLVGGSDHLYVGPFLRRLERIQRIIRQVFVGWEWTVSKAFDNFEDAREFAAVTAREGVVRDLVLTLFDDELPLDGAHRRAVSNPRIQSLPNYHQILADWFEHLPQTQTTHTEMDELSRFREGPSVEVRRDEGSVEVAKEIFTEVRNLKDGLRLTPEDAAGPALHGDDGPDHLDREPVSIDEALLHEYLIDSLTPEDAGG